MTSGGLKDWPRASDAGKRANCITLDGEIMEGRIELIEYAPGEDQPTPLFMLASDDGGLIDWAELEGWTIY